MTALGIRALVPRDYQVAANLSAEADLADMYRRVAVVMPTGTGKTVTFAHNLDRYLSDVPGGRGLVLAHRDELVGQAVRKLHEVMPDMPVPGVVKAARNETNRPITVASIQTLASPTRRAQLADALGVTDGRPLRIIADECHHAVAPTWMSVLADLGAFRPADDGSRTTAIGYTATLGRTDGVALGKVWQRVSYEMDILEAIRERHLVDVRGLRIHVPALDLSHVRRVAGDFSEADLGDALSKADAPEQIAKAYAEHAGDRKGLAFLPTVATAQETADALNAIGITAAAVWGAMPLELRRATLAAAFAGEIQVLTTCMVLTEGFDWPEASCAIIARLTSSSPLYTQMVGRVLRTWPGKPDALVLDVVGVGRRHRLATLADLAGVEVPEGKTLVEAVAETTMLDDEDPVDIRAEKAREVLEDLGAREFDLFGESKRAWLRTRRGTWFIDRADDLVFLAPSHDPELYNVAIIPKEDGRGSFVREGLELSFARSWAEQIAADGFGTGTLTSRKAAWRRAAPTPGQLSAAAGWRIPGADTMTRGELSEKISTAVASRRLDRLAMFADPDVVRRAYERARGE